MKFQNFSAFSKHVQESLPDHLASIYLVISPCRFERQKICYYIVGALRKKQVEISPCYWDVVSHSLEEILGELNAESLFGSSSVVVYDGIEKFKKNELNPLLTQMEKGWSSGVLILGSASAKNTSDLYQQGGGVVVLDLSGEKPWDRKARFERYVVEFALQAGYRLSPDVAQYLLDHIGLDLPSLEQELVKLICFAADRKRIVLEDVHQICNLEKQMTTWQLAEMVIWEPAMLKGSLVVDIPWLIPFIGQLRYQLQIGMQLVSLLAQQLPLDEVKLQMAQLKGSLFEKRIHMTNRVQATYFQRGLDLLFSLEMDVKNNGGAPALLLDLFIAKMMRNKEAFSK